MTLGGKLCRRKPGRGGVILLAAFFCRGGIAGAGERVP